MTIFGVDTSLYQPLGSYDPASFEIVNALDPTLPQKVARNQAEGRPWGIYSWVFPGEHGSYTVGRAIAALNKTGAAHAPLGFWWDYEDNGVVQGQLDQAFATSDAEGYWSGYYGNDYRFDHGPLLGRPFWLAGYPGNNDGTFPGFEQMRASRPVQLWQFTSTNGTLDQNAVADEAWYFSLTGNEDDMTPEEHAWLEEVHGILTGGGQYPSQEARIEKAVNDHTDEAVKTIPGGGGPTSGTWTAA